MPRITISLKNQRLARKLVQRYLDSMGGRDMGHVFVGPEVALTSAIAYELAKRDLRVWQATAGLRPRRRRRPPS